MEIVGRLAQLPAPVPFISAGAVMPYVIAGSCIDVMDRSLAALGTQKIGKRDDWPKNPNTSRLYQRHPFRRVISGLWRSAPEDWLRKAKELAREKLGSA